MYAAIAIRLRADDVVSNNRLIHFDEFAHTLNVGEHSAASANILHGREFHVAIPLKLYDYGRYSLEALRDDCSRINTLGSLPQIHINGLQWISVRCTPCAQNVQRIIQVISEWGIMIPDRQTCGVYLTHRI